MDKSSFFIKNKALFGGFPTQIDVEEYEKEGVRYFINLTEDGEKGINMYKTKYEYIHYPIKDRRVPTDWKSFADFIIRLSKIIKKLKGNDKLFISCKAGHGRSGVVVACLLCYIYKMSPSVAISKTTRYHGRRKVMRDKWRKIGSPQTRSQKHFVTKFFEPLYIYPSETNYFSYGFNISSDFTVTIPNFGLFPRAISAYYALKSPNNNTYIGMLEQCTDPHEIENIFNNEPTTEDWENNKKEYMCKVLMYKFEQHSVIKGHLLNTGLRPIIFYSSNLYLGKNQEGLGKNIFGKILMKIRRKMYFNLHVKLPGAIPEHLHLRSRDC